jgi:hypothetical protein
MTMSTDEKRAKKAEAQTRWRAKQKAAKTAAEASKAEVAKIKVARKAAKPAKAKAAPAKAKRPIKPAKTTPALEAGAPRGCSKLDQVIALLRGEAGATLNDLMAATGWLPPTTRAVLSRLRNERGYTVERTAEKGEAAVYRIAPAAKAA